MSTWVTINRELSIAKFKVYWKVLNGFLIGKRWMRLTGNKRIIPETDKGE